MADKEYMKSYNKARYERLKADGLCVMCKEPMNGDTHVYCRKCREYCARVANQYKRTPQTAEYFRLRYNRLAEAGLCVRCSTPMGEDTHRRCSKCREIVNERRRENRARKREENA